MPHIRPFRIGDEAALRHVFYTAIHQLAVNDYTAEQLQVWGSREFDPVAWAERMRGINPFIAEVDGQIAGYADLQAGGYIDHFYVGGDFARQGIGRCLMEHIHQEAQQRGLTELTADVSRTAQPFFARFGFHIVEERFPVWRGVTIPNALMRKDLSP